MRFFSAFLLLVFLPIFPAFALIAGGCGTACISSVSGSIQDTISLNFILSRQAIIVALFYLSGYICGRLVIQKKISASISRKIVCILTFAASYANTFFMPVFSMGDSLIALGIGTVSILLILTTLSNPFRNKIRYLRTVFSAINRPEDEPHTLLWLSTEAVVTGLVIAGFLPLIAYVSKDLINTQGVFATLLLIPIFASGIGDALAEIVGKKYGRHTYTTHSIIKKRAYTRSLEGSAMVFLTTVLTGIFVLAVHSFNVPYFVWKSVILLPITLTIAEAKSPHTWDNPIMYATGYLTIILCVMA
jgi:dolichol kinase